MDLKRGDRISRGPKTSVVNVLDIVENRVVGWTRKSGVVTATSIHTSDLVNYFLLPNLSDDFYAINEEGIIRYVGGLEDAWNLVDLRQYSNVILVTSSTIPQAVDRDGKVVA